MSVRNTITLPKPLHEFAIEESKELMKKEKGVKKKNLSFFLTELVRDARDRKVGDKKAA